MLSQEILDDCALCEAIMERNRPERLNGLPCIPFRLIIDHIFTYLELECHMYKRALRHYDDDHLISVWSKLNHKHMYGYFTIDRCRKVFLLWRRFYIKVVPKRPLNEETIIENIENIDLNIYTSSSLGFIQSLFDNILPQNILSIHSNCDVLDNMNQSYLDECVNLDMIDVSVIPENPWLDQRCFPNLKTLSINTRLYPPNIKHINNIIDFIDRHNLIQFKLNSHGITYPNKNIRNIMYVKFCKHGSSIIDTKSITLPLCKTLIDSYPQIRINIMGFGINLLDSWVRFIQYIRPKMIIGHFRLLRIMNLSNVSIIHPFVSCYISPYLKPDIFGLHFNDFIEYINITKSRGIIVCPRLVICPNRRQLFPWTWVSLIADMRRKLERE